MDRAIARKYSQFLHDRLGNATLCIIPGAGHYVMREQAEHVNQAITEWMEKI
jgi:pimeloyl-ACP methyl ester carboxylesterase